MAANDKPVDIEEKPKPHTPAASAVLVVLVILGALVVFMAGVGVARHQDSRKERVAVKAGFAGSRKRSCHRLSSPIALRRDRAGCSRHGKAAISRQRS